jgi:catechol 2,3-dioxygenase-like lactoylglutathione lyase family enzyme
MIDHIGISVGSIARATEFYLKALAPLGYGIVMEVSAEETGHGAAIAFGAPGQAADFQSGKPSFWVGESAKASGPLHVAFVAPSRAAVDVFYHAAIAAGGADNGAPGLRPQYHAAYYAAFVLDPDGNNIEAVCHGPEREPSRSAAQQRQLMSCLLRPATCGPTWLQTNRHVCLWHKADIDFDAEHVRFRGQSGHL